MIGISTLKFLVITDGRLLQYAFGFRVTHNKWLAGFNQRGLTSNSLEAFGANLGYRLGKNFQVVYNYEYTLSLLRVRIPDRTSCVFGGGVL